MCRGRVQDIGWDSFDRANPWDCCIVASREEKLRAGLNVQPASTSISVSDAMPLCWHSNTNAAKTHIKKQSFARLSNFSLCPSLGPWSSFRLQIGGCNLGDILSWCTQHHPASAERLSIPQANTRGTVYHIYIYIYSCIVNPTYSWIISDGYSTFPTSSCFLSLATLFLKPSRSPDWPLPFSRRCVGGIPRWTSDQLERGGTIKPRMVAQLFDIYMWVSIYIYGYGPAFQPPSPPPRPWSWVSDSTVPLPAPVVWWGCGTVPLPLGMVCLIWQYVCSVRYVWLLWWVWNVCYVR